MPYPTLFYVFRHAKGFVKVNAMTRYKAMKMARKEFSQESGRFIIAIGEDEMTNCDESKLIKPLFIPLKKEYYFKFESGEQDCEIRPNNHRAWNIKNVFPGRMMTISNGYGNYDRTTLEIKRTLITQDLRTEEIPRWHIDAVENIYGKRDSWLIAYV